MNDEPWELLPKEGEPRRERPVEAPDRKKRLAAAFVVAAISDVCSAGLEFVAPLQWTLDVATAGFLFLILGRQWMILPGLVAEAIPGLALFPFWVLVVGSIGIWGTINPTGKKPPQA
ncbi:MAG TPA: hypothetical protein VLZ12_13175 [Verrucomicrobiae bacterium]|nr:hypothetical protein [Verrucomicrobiae bacterium]